MKKSGSPARLLDTINAPKDLKPLTYKQLHVLAGEVRETIIGTVTKNGGHLASNLGIVELTLAIHRVFNSPKDKIVWDTTNQCYTHKLVTGRRDRFSTLRQEGGLSGFGEPAESPHDPLVAGHAGTGLSIGMGIAMANALRGDDSYVVVVVGDGALTAGMCYEALNNIVAFNPKRLILIVNDNGMSISSNVGWMTNWRSRIALNPEYHKLAERSKRLATRFPKGERAWQLAQRMKDSIQGMIVPNMFWEDMGFRYVGPLDGHDMKTLEKVLEQAKRSTDKVPVLHVLTKKGLGFPPAEQDPVKYHQPGSPIGPGAPTYSRVVADTLVKVMDKDPQVVAISAAMLEGTALSLVKERFPTRVLDVGIAEQHAVSMAAGMARLGYKPFVAIYSTFLQRSYDQIVHDMALQNLPVMLGIDRAGLVGEDGKTHQGVFDISYTRSVPNMLVCSPKDENELQHLVYTLYRSGKPSAVRYPRGAGYGVPMDRELRELPIGEAEVLRRGRHGVILALGSMVKPALDAAAELAQEGIDLTVVNARWVKPIDRATLREVCSDAPFVLTVEEHLAAGGFGSAVLEALSSLGLAHLRIETLGVPDQFIEHGPQSALRQRLGLDAKGVAQRVRLLASRTLEPAGARS